MDNDVHSLLDSVLDAHSTVPDRDGAENAPQFAETPYAFTRTADDALARLCGAGGFGGAPGAAGGAMVSPSASARPTDAAWLEGTGRAVIVHDRAVNDDLLAQIGARMRARTEAGGADASRHTDRAGDGDGRDAAGRRGPYATAHLRIGRRSGGAIRGARSMSGSSASRR